MFYNIDVTQKALDALMLKQNVVVDNITNVDTPSYRRKDVSFESVLAQEIEKKGRKNLDITSLEPTLYTDRQNYTGRIDGNNVDIDIEMAELTQTKLKYDTLITRTSAQLNRYKNILQTLK